MKIVLWLFLIAFVRAGTAADVTPGREIDLSRDAGSHQDYRTEWWYLTGWLQDESGARRGFQVTFFRSRNAGAEGNPSKFAAKQLVFAHAALADPSQGRLLRAERTARAGFDLADAKQSNLNVFIDNWSLRQHGDHLTAQIDAEQFSLQLEISVTQAILLQGDNGYSKKGPQDGAASYYYSLPHLDVKGSIYVKGKLLSVIGEAWFDHEWSNEYVDAQAIGWDWIGINLNDGGALMAFRMRDSNGKPTWAGGTWRTAEVTNVHAPDQVVWSPTRFWRSPRTGVSYPVAWRVRVGARVIELQPLMDDQENDARGSVGVLYWEGAVEALDESGKSIGRGYLELTGYGEPARF
ncbi:MAG TPA: lipocalin-like domain-containing protein [Steroidobacteraceae bacterium]|nr:lipocalin-like domain-containing protein [Steroidobacteraceae bacterium]